MYIKDIYKKYLTMNTESKVDIYDDSKTTTKKKDEVAWRSCCLIVDPHAIAYFSQIFITLIVLAISTYFLILSDGDCNKRLADGIGANAANSPTSSSSSLSSSVLLS